MIVLSGMLAACDEGMGIPDAGDSGVEDGGDFIAPPEIPWLDVGRPPVALPMFTPCPEGWQEVVGESGAVTCEPYGGDPEVCPGGSAHFLGEAGCVPVGAPCPVGNFPEGLPTGVEVIYVLSSAPAGGDGSEGSPLQAIAEALEVASPGTVIAVGKGVYDGVVNVGPGITLWGACARDTRLTNSAPGMFGQAVIRVFSEDVLLKNLRLGPATVPGVMASGVGASVSVDGLLIEEVTAIGLVARNGVRLQGRDLCISGTRPDGTESLGRGVQVESGGVVNLTRVLISDNHEFGAVAVASGTSLTLSDAVIKGTKGRADDGTRGQGLGVHEGASAQVTRGLLSNNRDIGVFVTGHGTALTLSDVVVEGTQAQESDGMSGWGLSVQGGTVDVSRVRFSRNRDVGVLAAFEGTVLRLSDVVVEGTQAQESDGMAGWGLGVQGGTVDVSRVRFSNNRDVGVFVAGASATMSDVVIENTLEHERDGSLGRGIVVQLQAAVTITRGILSNNREMGVFVSGTGTSLALSDVLVEGTRSQESDGEAGRGLGVQEGGTVEVSRGRFSRNHDVGILATSPGTSVTLSDVVVEQTYEQGCADTSCSESPSGIGVVGAVGATLGASRFAVRASTLCGVMVALDAEVDLSDGEVSGSPIGVCLQVDGYRVTRLTERVRYLDNGTNLDATTLPVPGVLGLGD